MERDRDETLMEAVGESTAYVKQYIRDTKELVKLKLVKKGSNIGTYLILGFVLLNFGYISLLLLCIAGGLLLATWVESMAGGFAIMAAIIITISLIIYLLRKQLIMNPMVDKLIKKAFEDEETNED